MIKRTTLIVNILSGADATPYIESAINDFKISNNVADEEIINIQDKEKYGIFKVSIYYVKKEQ